MRSHQSDQTVIEGFRITSPVPSRPGIEHLNGGVVTVRSCIFETLDPGINVSVASIVLEDSEFRDNESLAAGSALRVTSGQVWISGCRFIDCEERGAVSLVGGVSHAAEIRNSVFTENSGISGALTVSGYGALIVDRCEFVGNVAALGSGGAMVVSMAPGRPQVTDCIFRGNAGSVFAGAVAMSPGSVSGCTFFDSHVTAPLAGAAAALHFLSAGDVTVGNNVFATTSGAPAVTASGSVLTSSCNVFWDNAAGVGIPVGPTDRISDPEFCDPANGDLTVATSSPCLPANSGGCGLIGAGVVGCGPVSVSETSWATIKASYRQP
jgi:hypothetical protein